MNKKRVINFFNLKNKRGQVTIFVILGLIIVGAAALVYFLYPTIKTAFTGITDPQSFIQTCLQDKIKNTITNLSLQGGTMMPKHYFLFYNDELGKAFHVDYLCYTNQNYMANENYYCTVQQPLLLGHIRDEIKSEIQPTADSCFNDLEKSYQSKGYAVNFVKGETIVNILPKRVLVTFNNQLTLTKETGQRYENFTVITSNNLYDFIGVADGILDWEVSAGDAPIQLFMQNYHNMLVQKVKQSEGTKIYVLKNINTGETFQFASRSRVFPLGL